MNVGFKHNMTNQVCLFPFHVIDGVLVQYSFGFKTYDGFDFETKTGKVKGQLFANMIDVSSRTITIFGKDKKTTIEKMRNHLNEIKSGFEKRKAVLFVIERTSDGETPFFEAKLFV